jgi:hypothetical protein
MYFFTTDDNEQPDPQYEAYLAAFTEEDEYESMEKGKNKHRGRYARSARRRNGEEDSGEESDYNPAEPLSRSPDSHNRRQEYLAKAVAAAGSMYAY